MKNQRPTTVSAASSVTPAPTFSRAFMPGLLTRVHGVSVARALRDEIALAWASVRMTPERWTSLPVRASALSGSRVAASWRLKGVQSEAVGTLGRSDPRLPCVWRGRTEAQEFITRPNAQTHLADIARKRVGLRTSLLLLPARVVAKEEQCGRGCDANGDTNREQDNAPSH